MLGDFFTQELQWSLPKIIVITAITMVALAVLFSRINRVLRNKIKQQAIDAEKNKAFALHDQLTQLPNLALCYDRLEHAIAQAELNNTSIAVAYIGINDIKTINSQQGHQAGDKLLQEVATRLTKELRPGDTLARNTGGEFIIIFESLTDKQNVNTMASILLTKLLKPYKIIQQQVNITCNMGISVYPNDSHHSKELINDADKAMRTAQQDKKRLAFFSKEIQDKVNAKKNIAEQLRGALSRNELELYYQPIVSTRTHEIIGVEALLRWNHKKLGELSPDVFIPIAEEIGIINQLGDWVLRQACKQNKAWQEQGLPKIVMSINLSVMQLAIDNYAETVANSLDATHLESKYLELEMTEETLMKDVKQAINQVRLLKVLDVTVALDDFGTGYSSMKFLPKFGLKKVKIDSLFTRGLPDNEDDIKTVRAIVAMAEELGLQVTAEGVETAEQCKFIESCNIDAIQGYYFSKAINAEEFTSLLAVPLWLESKTAS